MNNYTSRIANKLSDIVDNRQLRRFEVKRLEKLLLKNSDSSLNILYICTGNICRSAFADVLTKMLIQSGETNLIINSLSAGTNTQDGLFANDDAIRIAKEFNLDLNPHRTKSLTKELANKSTIIFAMEPMHVLKLAMISPRSLRKTFLLSALDEIDGITIIDPYAKSDQVFSDTFSRIKFSVERLLEIINRSTNSV